MAEPVRSAAPTTASSAEFYDRLLTGRSRRRWWGADRRFDADKIADSRSVARFFTAVIAEHVDQSDRVLDLGCGTGGFLAATAPLVHQIVGVDIGSELVTATASTIERRGLDNGSVERASGAALPFADATFDAVLLVDVIHHLERIEPVLDEVHRVLRPGGRLLVFEPNKRNPLLFAMCVLDRNEWGLLRLGTAATYDRLMTPRFGIDEATYNGVLIGPDGPLFMRVAEWLAPGGGGDRLRWLSPKLFVAATRR